MKKLFLLLLPLFINAQDVAIGQWKDYLSYNSASYLCEVDKKIYCVASSGLFFLNKEDNTINRLSKINGLSDVGVKFVAHSESGRVIIIVYDNCNVDLIKNEQIINISDIKRKEIIGIKSINNVKVKNNIAYLSTSFGLILIDIIANEIKDTYNIRNIEGLVINSCAFLGDSIIVATNNGLYASNTNHPNLTDYNAWAIYDTTHEICDDVIYYNGEILTDSSAEIIGITYKNNTLITITVDTIYINQDNGNINKISHSKFENIKHAIIDKDQNLWVADSINGLLKFENYEYQSSYRPEGPVRNECFSLDFANNKLYQCHGGHANFGTNLLINDGVSIKTENDNWLNYDRYKLGNARDILRVAVRDGKEYFASWYHGISEMQDGELVIKYGFANTNGVLDTTWYSNNRIRISDIKFDEAGNMWALSSEVNHPLVVKTKNNEWHSFSINQNQVGLFFDELLIDAQQQKWGIIGRGGGLIVYNENNTIDNPSDDKYIMLNTNIGSGNLPSNTVYCLTNDLEGEIWVGTDKGVAVFYSPELVFSGLNFDSQQILITEGDYGQYLLSEEKVKSIAVDGANRKWIGTEKSGIFLLSSDGTEEILHFTKENSPLFSNNITDITINQNNGEVYIGTEKGLISYRYNATFGEIKQGETKVFPNPVKENYLGPIAISGLVSNANVKITDMMGNLVFESVANGGQAIWNGLNQKGQRASSGIYLVFSTDIYGKEKIVSKILFIH